MSLVIASNYQDEYSGQLEQDRAHKTNSGTPMQSSSFFSNHLKNPMIIPPHSEVAVQSVKINRLPINAITTGNRFHLYWGLALEDSDGQPKYRTDESFSIPIPCTIAPGTYNQDEMRDIIQEELRRALGHPTWFDKLIVKDLKVGDLWQGYTFDFKCHDKAPATNVADKMEDWVGYVNETAKAPAVGEYSVVNDAGGKKTTLKRLKADGQSLDCTITDTSCPMDLTSGVVEIDLFDKFGKAQNAGGGSAPTGNAYRRNACGFHFSRPRRGTDTDEGVGTGNEFRVGGDVFDDTISPSDSVSYGDYRIDWAEFFAEDAGYRLVVSHAVWDDDENGVVMKEIPYWEGLPGGDGGDTNPVKTQIKEAVLVDNTTNPGDVGYIGKFKVEFKGTGIKLSMVYWTKAGGEVWKVICDTTLVANRVNHDKVWAPINQNKWALYMGWGAKQLNHDSVITKLYWNDTLRSSGLFKYGQLDGIEQIGSSWWSQAMQDRQGGGSANNKLDLARLVERRENNRGLAGSTIHWQDLSASSDCPSMSKALVLVSAGDTQTKGVYYPSRGANMGTILGFPDWHAVSSAQLGVRKNQAGTTKSVGDEAQWAISSATLPLYAVHDCFIKCPTLTAQSYNFCKSIPSQILYHIPRWTPDGRQYGVLFHEATEKTYIALKNADAIQCNLLDFQIVDKNEQIVGDLTGDTTIVLHIRQR